MVQASVFAIGVLGAGSANARLHTGIAGTLLALVLLFGVAACLVRPRGDQPGYSRLSDDRRLEPGIRLRSLAA
jgi:hypothetical protein